MNIIQLSPHTINKIAAGEVIENPASVVKELVENSIDAKSTKIKVTIHNAGRNLVRIIDNGLGMTKEDLNICVLRHTTSKLNEEDLMDINSFGFRGEALSSISAVSRLNITSKRANHDVAYSISVEGGEIKGIKPAALEKGTIIEVKDLFFATPVRLKFLKEEKKEQQIIIDVITKLALSYPEVGFVLENEQKTLLDFPEAESLRERIKQVFGEEFIENSNELNLSHEMFKIEGFASLATYTKSNRDKQYFFINNRAIEDKIFYVALKAAYMDVIEPNKHPVIIAKIICPNDFVDVNVHPAKSAVRFKDSNLIRNYLIGAINNSIKSSGNRVSSHLGKAAFDRFFDNKLKMENNKPEPTSSFSFDKAPLTQIKFEHKDLATKKHGFEDKLEGLNFLDIPKKQMPEFIPTSHPVNSASEVIYNQSNQSETNRFSLGAAIGQVSDNYIIARNQDGIVIIDQHAAHERLVYEEYKKQFFAKEISRQMLLIPEEIELDENRVDLICKNSNAIKSIGFVLEKFGRDSLLVREIPAIFKKLDVKSVIISMANDLAEHEIDLASPKAFEHILETMACHNSIRSGRALSIEEMNNLLRKIEDTEFSAQCNHGRPSYIYLSIKDINKLFSRE